MQTRENKIKANIDGIPKKVTNKIVKTFIGINISKGKANLL